jgi:bla regulator protein blaR1
MRVAAALFAASLIPMALPAAPKGQSDEDAYILAIGDQWTSGDINVDDIVRMRTRLDGDFLWFRRNGKTYRVTDAATVGKADALFEPVRALEPELEQFRVKERRLDDRENELDREEELIEEDLEDLDADLEAGMPVDPNTRKNLESRRDAVRARMRDLEKEQRELEAVERQLDAREEKLENEAEKKLWRFIDEAIASGAAKAVPPR